MSAANILLQPGAGYLFADAVGWGPDGAVSVIESKIVALPWIPAAVTLRGWSPGPAFLEWAFRDTRTLARLLDLLPPLARMIARRTGSPEGYDPALGASVELSCVAWDGDRPAGWTVSTDDETGELEAAPVLLCRPGISDVAFLGKPLACEADVFGLDPERDGLAIMQAQRRETTDIPGIGPLHIVGGFCEMATVTADGVERRIIHRWPDRVGERIDPSPAPSGRVG